MPHVLVTKAQAVLVNSSAYPEVICQDAQAIVEWARAKNAAMRAMWEKHSLLTQWITLRDQSKGRSYADRCREATRLLGKTVSRTDMDVLHVARQYLRNTKLANAMLFGRFDSCLQLLQSNDLERIHRYLACVNARRTDLSLEPVGFLRWCGHSAVSEILAWKLLRAEPRTGLPA